MLDKLKEVLSDLLEMDELAARVDGESHKPSAVQMQEGISKVQDKLYNMTTELKNKLKE